MKHLKRFNESLDELGLKDFCEETLAYLLDEGFIVDIKLDWRDLSGNTIPLEVRDQKSYYIASVYTITLYNSTNGTSRNTFTWDDIKDYYIPFLQLLSRRYSLVTQKRINQVCVVSRLPGGLMRDYYSYDFVVKDGYEGFKNELADSELYEVKIQVHNQ